MMLNAARILAQAARLRLNTRANTQAQEGASLGAPRGSKGRAGVSL
jgi:hypothetical protein